MFELVPPKSKTIEYESIHLKEITFILKVFNFEEDNKFTQIILDNRIIADGKEDDFNGEQYYIDAFKLGVKEIKGIEGPFSPSWRVIKEIVNKIIEINTATNLEK